MTQINVSKILNKIKNGGPGEICTPDTEIFSLLLYCLSYRTIILLKKRLADHTGIEPVIFSVTGRHVNRYTNGPFSQRLYIIIEIKQKCNNYYHK